LIGKRDEAAEKAAREKVEQRVNVLRKAHTALTKYNTSGQATMSNADWQNIVRWVLPESKVKNIYFKNLKKIDDVKEFLNSLNQPWAMYITIPQIDSEVETENNQDETENNVEAEIV